MNTPVRKKLIEVSIPLEAINVASAREKSIRHGHPSTLHLWWARRPLAACRAVLFAQLVDDPSSWPDRFPTEETQDSERRRLHKVIEAMVPWEASNNEAILNAARWEIARSVAWGLGEDPPARGDGAAILDYLQTKAPPVYDPFSGGGSIPLEAQRLGLRAFGSDLNPVAVLIGKALVEIPPKFAGCPPVNPESRAEAANGQLRAWKGAQGLAEDVRYYGQWMRNEAQKRIGHLYPKATLPDGSQATVIAWLWARTIRSPDPSAKGEMVPLVSSFLLSRMATNKAWAGVVLDSQAEHGWRFSVQSGSLTSADEERLKAGTKSAGRGANFACALTGSAISANYIKQEGTAGRLGERLMAVVAEGRRGRVYLEPTTVHEEAANVDIAHVDEIDVDLSRHPQYMGCVPYGLDTVAKLFNARQRTALATLAGLVGDACNQMDGVDAAYVEAVAAYLAFSVTSLANSLSEICTWDAGGPGWGTKVRNTFSRQALPMTWDYAEINPFSGNSGSYDTNLEYIARSVSALEAHKLGTIDQRDAAVGEYPITEAVISTDPPYYDSIPYADLSDFFYPWLRLSLRNTLPGLFRRLSVPKDNELVADTRRHGGRVQAETFFMDGMSRAIRGMHENTVATCPTVIYYAFKQSELASEGVTSSGWASFLQAVLDAGFNVDGTWPIRTELATRMRGIGSNALASSIVLVCRKRSPEAAVIPRSDFIRALKREMPSAINAIRKAGVGPVDMQQSVIGPGMGVFSRYAKVLEDDDNAMSVKTALAVINRVWEEIENELDEVFDPETQVALAWYATYGFDARASGELITLTTAKNTSDRALFASGVFKDMKGKTGLTPREELPAGWSPASDKTLTTWECVQHTARVLNAADGGGEAAAALVSQMGPKAEEARALAYRLFEIATNKGWAAEALVYNELAQEWSKLEDRAASLDDAGRAHGPNQSTFAFDGNA